ncbi:hypothetical protein Hanom_Chr06g00571031 [Helianthus anomalus]
MTCFNLYKKSIKTLPALLFPVVIRTRPPVNNLALRPQIRSIKICSITIHQYLFHLIIMFAQNSHTYRIKRNTIRVM